MFVFVVFDRQGELGRSQKLIDLPRGRNAVVAAHTHNIPIDRAWRSAAKNATQNPVRSKMELHAHHFGGVNRPAACSITSPRENSVSSSNGRPISCSPSGSPSTSLP